MIDWNYIVIGLSSLLLFFLILKEIARKNKARILWRLMATVFAISSLACIALPVSFNHTKTVILTHRAVLLTEGFNSDSVNKFLSANHNNIPVLTVDKNVNAAQKYNAAYLPDISFLSQQYQDIYTFHVFGYGFDKDVLNGLKNVSIIFHPTELSSGITFISWPQKIKTGEKLFIQGSFNNSSASKAKIVLRDFNSTLDSMNIPNGKNEKFQLTTIPKHSGRAVYTIAVVANKDTIEKESIPVQVEQGESLKVLMLASSPDFDNKFLKNELSQNGYKVVARTAISKNKYLKEYLNTPSIPLKRITSSLLDNFDITIADATELAAISASELAAIQAQVAQKSMGLIIKADSAFSGSSFYSRKFQLNNILGDSGQQASFYLLDTAGKMPATTIENSLFIRNQTATQPIVFDKQNRIYVNSALYGSGKIILTALTNTYHWALSGNQTDYNKFWAELLNKASPKPATDESWSIFPALPQINKPAQLQLQTNNAGIPQGQVNGAAVYLRANYDLPFQWTGTYYPVKYGWQTGIQLNGHVFYWYAYNHNDWKNLFALQKTKATKQYIFEILNNSKSVGKSFRTGERGLKNILFFLIFLLSCGFLWFEDKFFNNQ